MADYFILFKDWVIALGEKHAVDPLVLGSLYLVSKVLFFSLLAVTLKKLRAGKPLLVTLGFAFLSFSLPYLYLLIAGRNISVWVYVFVAGMLLYGAFTIWKKVLAKPVVVGP